MGVYVHVHRAYPVVMSCDARERVVGVVGQEWAGERVVVNGTVERDAERQRLLNGCSTA